MFTCHCGKTLKAVDRYEDLLMTQFMCPDDDGSSMHFGAWVYDPDLKIAVTHGRMKKPDWAEPPDFQENTAIQRDPDPMV